MPKTHRTSTVRKKPYPRAQHASRRSSPTRRKTTEMRTTNIAQVSVRIVKELDQLFLQGADHKYAPQMKKYMRNQFEFYGIRAPAVQDMAKQVFSSNVNLTSSDVLDTVKLLWEKDQREFQYCGIKLLIKNRTDLAANADICCQSTDVVKELLTEKSWWDTVDMLASNVIGYFAQTQPDQMDPVLEDWITSENMWLRRTAILHQLSYKANTDQGKLFRYCLQCCHEKEFFIQKSIGWALREYHKTQPKAVKAFVAKHSNAMAKLSVREALKHANKS